MSDTAIVKAGNDPFWNRVRSALATLRPVRRPEAEPAAYSQAAMARSLGIRPKLGNRIEEELSEAWTHSAARKVSLSLLVIEVDRFKDYFATYGKAATEDCLLSVMGAVTQCLPRPEDCCLRLGRSGFVVVLPDYPVLMARATAATITAAIGSEALAHKESHAGIVTASIGLAVVNPDGVYDKKFFETAAEALKKAQRRGLGRTEVIDLRPAQERRRKAG